MISLFFKLHSELLKRIQMETSSRFNLKRAYLAIILCSLFACKPKVIEQHSPEILSNYIVSHTVKHIAQNAPIYVRFNDLPYDDSKINKEANKAIISISPSVKGKFVWENNYTLRFESEESLGYNRKYIVNVGLGNIYDETEIKNYQFEINTDQYFFNVSSRNLKPDVDGDKNDWLVSASFETNAELRSEDLSEIFSISPENSSIQFTNFIKKSDLEYQVDIKPFTMKSKAQDVALEWNISEHSIKGSSTFNIPALYEFNLMSVDVINTKDGHLRAIFSNQLAKQNFNGLVRIENYKGPIKFSNLGNQLDIFINNDVVGEQKIVFDANIKDVDKLSLKKNVDFSLLFKSSKPGIRAANNGTIVPYTDKVIFPFEAIALDTVEVEVYKIFENNILDFLRYNQLSSTYMNQFFGRVIHSQKIALKSINGVSNLMNYVRYALDLQNLTSIDPGAVYQVRIGFKKSFANLSCSVDANNFNGRGDNHSAFKSFRYYDGYRYEHEEDPCYPAYYNNSKFIFRNLLASNLGLIVKRGKNNNFKVIATDLLTGKPLSGVNIKLYDNQQQVMTDKVTDDQGMVDMISERYARYLIGKQGNNYGYVSLEDQHSNEMSAFDVSGVSQKGDINGYLFGERGVWRPGDTLHLSYMLYDKKNTITSGHPIKLEVKDSKGKTKYSFSKNNNENGYYVFHVPTSSSDPTGMWTATASLGNMKVSKKLKIETIKPNRLKVDLTFKNDELDVSGNESFTLDGKWLHGAPASLLKAQVDVKYSKASSEFENYKDFEFTDPARKIKGILTNVFEGNLDDNGQRELKIKFGKDFRPPGKLNANLRTRVFEKSGNFSEDYTNVKINPFETYVGVKVPENRWGGRALNVEKNEAIEIVAVDKNGKLLKNRNLSIGIYNAKWRWWYSRNNSNIYQYNSSEHYNAEEKKTLKTNANGHLSFVPELNGHGNYLVRVCDTESGHCSGQLFYTSYYSSNNKDDGKIAQLNFNTDKDVYQTNDEIVLNIPTSPNSKVLVSLENNEEVIDAFWVESTGEMTTVPFKVRPEMLPNVYVHATLVQPASNNNDLPMRLYGVKSIKVEDPNTILTPTISCEEVFEPNSKVNITVGEKEGKEMSYTLAVIDEGLLDITNFITPNPSKYFFAKQSLGVKSWDVYDLVLNKNGSEIEKIFSIGGDDSNNQESKNPSANRFKSVVKFLGPFTLKGGKSINHSIEIPNYIGSVRVMVVGKTRKAFGRIDKNIPVKKPLMVLSTLPRVLAPGEKLSMPVNVFAYQNDIRNVQVKVDSDSYVKSIGSKNKTLSFDTQGDKLAYFDFMAGDQVGIAHFDVDVSSGKYSAKERIEIEIRNPNPEQNVVYSELVKSGESWNKSFENVGMQGSNSASIEISKFPSFNVDNRLRYLVKYPYGCVEQTTSSVFPQLFLDEISKMDDNKKLSIKRNVKAAIRRLQSFQTARGGLAYWPGSTNDNEWGTNYAGHFMLEAKNRGYFINESFLNEWIVFQKSKSDNYVKNNGLYHQRTQAYRLYTLALAGKANLSAMNQLRVDVKMPKVARFLLAGAYGLIGQDQVALDLIHNLDYAIQEYDDWYWTYGSSVRDRSIILMTLMQIGKSKDAFKLAVDLAEKMGSHNWYSTQTTAFGLMALSKFLGQQSKDDLVYDFDLDKDMTVSHSSAEALDLYNLDLSKKQNHKFNFTNKSKGDIYVQIVNSGKPLPQPTPSFSNELEMQVVYKDTDGKSINPNVLSQGTDFIAEITITNASKSGKKFSNLALNHALPSGWEIQNLRLGDMGASNTTDTNRGRSKHLYDFQDVRDASIYTFFDLNFKESKKFETPLTATYAGDFFMPNISCEAMYDAAVVASQTGAWIKVIQD